MAHIYLTLAQAQVLEYYRMGLGEPSILLINHSHSTSHHHHHHHKKVSLREKGAISRSTTSKNPVKATINPRHYSAKTEHSGYYANTYHEADLTNHPILHWKRWNNNTLYQMAKAHVENFRQHIKDLLAYEKSVADPHTDYRPVSRAVQAHGYDSPEYFAAYIAYTDKRAAAQLKAQENRKNPPPYIAWDRVDVMADALEEAGCADETLLGILRGPAPTPCSDAYNDPAILQALGEYPKWNPPEQFRVYTAADENDPEFRKYRKEHDKLLAEYTTARAKLFNAKESYDWTIYRLCLRIAHR